MKFSIGTASSNMEFEESLKLIKSSLLYADEIELIGMAEYAVFNYLPKCLGFAFCLLEFQFLCFLSKGWVLYVSVNFIALSLLSIIYILLENSFLKNQLFRIFTFFIFFKDCYFKYILNWYKSFTMKIIIVRIQFISCPRLFLS